MDYGAVYKGKPLGHKKCFLYQGGGNKEIHTHNLHYHTNLSPFKVRFSVCNISLKKGGKWGILGKLNRKLNIAEKYAHKTLVSKNSHFIDQCTLWSCFIFNVN